MPHCQTGSDTRVKNAIHCNSTHSLHGTWACCHTRMSPPSNSFFNAVSGGDLTAVRQLLRDDATRVTQTSNGRTALHLAARNGFSSICSELASFGADLDAIDKEGYGPLHRACRHGHVEVCQVLSELGANVALDPAQQLTIPSRVALKSSRRAQVGTPLHVAAKNNRIQICELLVVTLKAPVNAATINGETPLHKAAALGNWPICKLLIQHGATIHSATTTTSHSTPLHKSAARGFVDTCRLLAHASPDAVLQRDARGRLPIHYAAESGDASTVAALLTSDTVNATDSKRGTPLHAAAEAGSAACCEMLLNSGAKVNAKRSNGMTPLQGAAARGHVKAMAVLLNHPRIKVDARDRKTSTALHKSAVQGHGEALKLLLTHGANPNALDYCSSTALHWAAGGGHEAVCVALVESGTNVDAVDFTGQTAFHWAARHGHVHVCKALVGCGAAAPCQGAGRSTVLEGERILSPDTKTESMHRSCVDRRAEYDHKPGTFNLATATDTSVREQAAVARIPKQDLPSDWYIVPEKTTQQQQPTAILSHKTTND